MGLVDRTNEDIPLSITGHILYTDVDSDSSFTPSSWLWLGDLDEYMYRLTYEEAERLHARLSLILGVDS